MIKGYKKYDYDDEGHNQMWENCYEDEDPFPNLIDLQARLDDNSLDSIYYHKSNLEYLLFQRARLEPNMLNFMNIPPASKDYISPQNEKQFMRLLMSCQCEKKHELICKYISFKIFHFLRINHGITLKNFTLYFGENNQGDMILNDAKIHNIEFTTSNRINQKSYNGDYPSQKTNFFFQPLTLKTKKDNQVDRVNQLIAEKDQKEQKQHGSGDKGKLSLSRTGGLDLSLGKSLDNMFDQEQNQNQNSQSVVRVGKVEKLIEDYLDQRLNQEINQKNDHNIKPYTKHISTKKSNIPNHEPTLPQPTDYNQPSSKFTMPLDRIIHAGFKQHFQKKISAFNQEAQSLNDLSKAAFLKLIDSLDNSFLRLKGGNYLPYNLKLSQFLLSKHYDYEYLRRVLDNYKSVKNEQVINGVYQNLDQNVKNGIKKEKKLQFLKD